MTSYTMLFISKAGKEVDRMEFNGPSKNFWEQEVVDQYAVKNPDTFRKVLDSYHIKYPSKILGLKYGSVEYGIHDFIALFRHVLYPFVHWSTSEGMINIYTKKRFKDRGAIKLIYKKEEHWSEDGEEVIDSKKNYSYVVYAKNDGGEFDKDEKKQYEYHMNFVKSAILLHQKYGYEED